MMLRKLLIIVITATTLITFFKCNMDREIPKSVKKYLGGKTINEKLKIVVIGDGVNYAETREKGDSP